MQQLDVPTYFRADPIYRFYSGSWTRLTSPRGWCLLQKRRYDIGWGKARFQYASFPFNGDQLIHRLGRGVSTVRGFNHQCCHATLNRGLKLYEFEDKRDLLELLMLNVALLTSPTKILTRILHDRSGGGAMKVSRTLMLWSLPPSIRYWMYWF